jgi:hypothetical protein
VPSKISGVNARFGGTYSFWLTAYSWDTSASARTVTLQVNQYEYDGGPVVSDSVSRTFIPDNDASNGMIPIGELTLPVSRLTPDNTSAIFTVTCTSTNTNDLYLDILFIDTMGQTTVISSDVDYTTYYLDAPDDNSDLGNISGSYYNRSRPPRSWHPRSRHRAARCSWSPVIATSSFTLVRVHPPCTQVTILAGGWIGRPLSTNSSTSFRRSPSIRCCGSPIFTSQALLHLSGGNSPSDIAYRSLRQFVRTVPFAALVLLVTEAVADVLLARSVAKVGETRVRLACSSMANLLALGARPDERFHDELMDRPRLLASITAKRDRRITADGARPEHDAPLPPDDQSIRCHHLHFPVQAPDPAPGR